MLIYINLIPRRARAIYKIIITRAAHETYLFVENLNSLLSITAVCLVALPLHRSEAVSELVEK